MFPNYSMFYKYRVVKGKDMAVLSISPEVLLEKECAFFNNNAASKEFKELEVKQMMNIERWNELFCENYGDVNREELELPLYYTTNPQAEVLCFDIIEPRYILDVCFENQLIFNKYRFNFPEVEGFYYIYKHFFEPRFDYSYWSK